MLLSLFPIGFLRLFAPERVISLKWSLVGRRVLYLHFLYCIFLCSQLYFLGKTYFSQVTSSQKKGCTRLNRLTHKGFETFSLLFPYLSLFCGNFFRWYSSEKKSCTRLNKSTDWPWAKRVQRGNCRPTLLYLHSIFCISAVLAFHILYFYCACIPHFVFLLCWHSTFCISTVLASCIFDLLFAFDLTFGFKSASVASQDQPYYICCGCFRATQLR